MRSHFPWVILGIILFSACTTRHDESRLKWINESLVTSNRIIAEANRDIYNDMASRQRDLIYRSRIEFWIPKLVAIEKISAELNAYIDTLKQKPNLDTIQQFFADAQKTGNLVYRLETYKKALIDSLQLTDNSQKPFLQNKLLNDVAIHDINNKLKQLNDASPLEALTVLNKIHNDVLVTENTLANYCKDMTSLACALISEKFTAIVTINSTYLHSAQPIEITAGLGAFKTTLNPTIKVNGADIPVNEEGAAIYQIKAPAKPGKYTIPITISFVKPDGSTALVNKTLHYTVAK